MKNIAIILSGGTGTRMGLNIPKQYLVINKLPILHYSVKTFLGNDKIDMIVICCAEEWKDFIQEHLTLLDVNKNIIYSDPGETRQLTIYNALKKLENICGDNDIVIIHDAARPLVSQNLINRCLDECCRHDGVLPVIKMKDTVYLSKDGKTIKSLLDRNQLFAGQAPEAFKYQKYIETHQRLSYEEILKINGSTEIAYKCGLDITLIEGDDSNFKITTAEDLSNFKNIINDES